MAAAIAAMIAAVISTAGAARVFCAWWQMRRPLHVEYLIPPECQEQLTYGQQTSAEQQASQLQVPQGKHLIILRFKAKANCTVQSVQYDIQPKAGIEILRLEAWYVTDLQQGQETSIVEQLRHGNFQRTFNPPRFRAKEMFIVDALRINAKSNGRFRLDIYPVVLGKEEIKLSLPLEVGGEEDDQKTGR